MPYPLAVRRRGFHCRGDQARVERRTRGFLRGRQEEAVKAAEGSPRRPDDGLTVRRVPGEDAWELALAAAMRLAAATWSRSAPMLAAGGLTWPSTSCDGFSTAATRLVEAHQLLGEIALNGGGRSRTGPRPPGLRIRTGCESPSSRRGGCRLPFNRPNNQPFFKLAAAAARWHRLGDRQTAGEIVNRLLALDPSDPLDVKSVLRPPPGSSEKEWAAW